MPRESKFIFFIFPFVNKAIVFKVDPLFDRNDECGTSMWLVADAVFLLLLVVEVDFVVAFVVVVILAVIIRDGVSRDPPRIDVDDDDDDDGRWESPDRFRNKESVVVE
jgi:hypothetical protein